MKFPLPAAAADAVAAQAQIETGASPQGIAFAVDLASPVNPTHMPTHQHGSTALPRLCFRSAFKAPRRHLHGGDVVSSLN